MTQERIDWNRLWKENGEGARKEDALQFWNNFAPRFRKKIKNGEDPYAEKFYRYCEFLPGESIFDMGCGSGTLAIPYARKGHEIYAADFSGEMLKHLMIGAEEEGVADRIHPIRLDWNEDWSARRDLPLCDVSISSRSFMPEDLTEGIRRLESVARRKVCMGAWDTPAPCYDRQLAAAVGYDRPGYGCYVYVMGELMDRDLMPALRFIKSPFRISRFDSPEDARIRLRSSFQYGLDEEQEQRLAKYLRNHLCRVDEGDRTYWKLDHQEISTVAHISWDVG